jgi:hypothetical protein
MGTKKRNSMVMWIVTAVTLCVCGIVMVVSYFRIMDARERVRASNDLKLLGLAYHRYEVANGTSPQSYEELAKFARTNNLELPPGAANATVVWGADTQEGEAVLGHTPASNGTDVMVLYANGSVKQETRATFEQAKKATPRQVSRKW